MEVACKTVEREHRAVTGRPAGAACRAAPDEVFHALRRSTLPGSRRLWHSCVNGRRDASKRQNRVARQKLETSKDQRLWSLGGFGGTWAAVYQSAGTTASPSSGAAVLQNRNRWCGIIRG